MKIVVLAGGCSTERDVSLSSGSLIANALMDAGHDVVMADVFCGVDTSVPAEQLFQRRPCPDYAFRVPETEPDLEKLKREQNQRGLIGPGVMELCRIADVVFIGLHGGMGENGQLQAVLDVEGIAYTGSDYDACLMAMDKDLTKRLLRGTGVRTPKGVTVNTEDISSLDYDALPYPCFVKPCRGGSSVGVSKAKNAEELRTAISVAEKYESSALIEELVSGREFSVGVLEGKALPAIEIRPKAEFYDYARKYQAGATEEICPAPVTEEQEMRLRAAAETVFRAIGLRDYARIDFMLDEKSGEFVCLEANTLPGMTPTSLLPQEAAAVGIDYRTLVCRLAELALRH